MTNVPQGRQGGGRLPYDPLLTCDCRVPRSCNPTPTPVQFPPSFPLSPYSFPSNSTGPMPENRQKSHRFQK